MDATAELVAASADIAVLLDKDGVVRGVSCENESIGRAGPDDWNGQLWGDTVTIESRQKIAELIADAKKTGKIRWRQVNHPVAGGADVPVTYCTIALHEDGRILALGRDLSSLAELQQRMVRNEQTIERELIRIRAVETRFRALFQLAAEAVLIADLNSLKVVEANPAAIEMFANGTRRIVGRSLLDLSVPEDRGILERMLTEARGSPRVDDVAIRLATSKLSVRVATSLFRQDGAGYLLLRLSTAATDDQSPTHSGHRSLAVSVLEHLPDAIVLCDDNRRILFANASFLDLVEMGVENQIRAEPIGRWLGRVKVDEDILFANLREHDTVRRYATAIRGEYGTVSHVEISGVAFRAGDTTNVCLSMRRLPRESTQPPPQGDVLPRSIEQLTGLVGRVPLKELVRETTDIIERMCIEAALELTGDNRASAAEMLGLSRQSLYVKLRRYGINEAEGDVDAD